jgi:hypothetical protein
VNAHTPSKQTLFSHARKSWYTHAHTPVLCVQAIYEVWGEGSTWEEMEASIKAYPEHLKAPWYSKGLTFKVSVRTQQLVDGLRGASIRQTPWYGKGLASR